MPGLLDNFLADPNLALGAGLLAPTRNGSFGAGLSQGLGARQQAVASQDNSQLRQLQAQIREQGLADANKFSSLISDNQALFQAGDPQGGFNLLGGSVTPNQAATAARITSSLQPSGGAGTFKDVLSDGTIGIFNPDGSLLARARDEDGNPVTAFEHEKEGGIADRAGSAANRADQRIDQADQRIKQTDKRLANTDRAFFQGREEHASTITQRERTSESAMSSAFATKSAPFRKQLASLGVLDNLLSGDVTALDEAAITNQVSILSDSNVRALANLNTFKNPGDLGTRLAGAISRFFSGTRTEKQLQDIRALSADLRKKVFAPALSEMELAYREAAVDSQLNPDNVVIGSKQRIRAKGNKQSLQEELDAINAELERRNQ
jgi:hypothetical protein